ESRVEIVFLEHDPLLLEIDADQIAWRTVRVIEFRDLGKERVRSNVKLIELLQSNGNRIRKPFFLKPHHLAYEFALYFELRIRTVHLVDDKITNLVEEQVHQAEMFAAVIDRPPHDLAEHVVAPFVAWQDAVSDRERSRPRVIRDHAASKLLGIGKILVDSH